MASKDATASLQERLALDSAEGWKPQEGDSLIGAIVNIKASNPNEYGVYPIVTVATPNGNIAVHAFHTILRDRLLEQRPAVGETIAIAYLGEKASKTTGKNGEPRTYHNYSVVVDRPESETAAETWDSFDTDTESE